MVENTEEHAAAVDDDDDANHNRRRSKKSKVVGKFQLDDAVSKLIKLDEQNRKLWDDVVPFVEQGHQVDPMSLC